MLEITPFPFGEIPIIMVAKNHFPKRELVG